MTLFDANDEGCPGYYAPTKTALLLTDFHEFIVEVGSGPKGKVAVGNASDLRAWAKSKGIAVVHSLIDLDADPFDTCKDRERFASRVKVILSSSKGAEPASLASGVSDNDDDEPTFRRQPGIVSALAADGLEDHLRRKGIISLIVCGLSTSGSVARTVFAATDARFVVTAISDACTDPDESLHDTFTTKVLPSRAYVATAAQFREGYDSLRH